MIALVVSPAEAVRETTEALAATGKRLDTATRGIDSSLWATGRIEDSVEMLRRYALRWTVAVLVLAGALLIAIVGNELLYWLGLNCTGIPGDCCV